MFPVHALAAMSLADIGSIRADRFEISPGKFSGG
jgi:hypothetical protein